MVILVVGGGLCAAIIVAAFRLAASLESWPPPTEPTIIRKRGPLPARPPTPPAIAQAGPGQILIADGEGRVFLIGTEEEEGAPPRLVLHRVYELKEDPTRHIDDDARKSYTGWYLDDLASERYRRVQATRKEFEDLIAAGGTGTEVVESLLGLARGLLREGEIPYLTEKLRNPSYLARRSAAIALGEGGWRRATPVLLEILRAMDEESNRLVAPILEDLTGIPAPAESQPDRWVAATRSWQDWWKKQN